MSTAVLETTDSQLLLPFEASWPEISESNWEKGWDTADWGADADETTDELLSDFENELAAQLKPRAQARPESELEPKKMGEFMHQVLLSYGITEAEIAQGIADYAAKQLQFC